MPTLLRIGPYRFFIYAADCRGPAHVHVEHDNNVAKFWLKPVRLETSGGFRRNEINRIYPWHPRLWHATASERQHWRLIGRGVGIHWPELDEDISLMGLIQGRPSNESNNFTSAVAERAGAATVNTDRAGGAPTC